MRSKTNSSIQRAQQIGRVKGDGPNWILIAGGALLSTLSIRFVCKLKQVFEARGSKKDIRGRIDSVKRRNGPLCQLHSDICRISQEESCFNCTIGDTLEEIKQASDSLISNDSDLLLPLVNIPKKHPNGCTMWSFSPELLELSNRPFHHHSTGSESPSISETGSDIYTKREVIHKLRQQLKRRDEMIVEMQSRIADLQNSLSSQTSQVARLRSQLDATNRELFVSDGEIQRLRKMVANNCLLRSSSSPEKLTSSANWQLETSNGYTDCLDDVNLNCVGSEKVKGDLEKMELLEKEVEEMREVAQGKDFLLQSYKEQTEELCLTIKDLELRLKPQQRDTF